MSGVGDGSPDEELTEVLVEMDSVLSRRRVYASFREIGPKEWKEVQVVRDLLTSFSVSDGPEYSDITSAAKDPPDCLAFNAANRLVAIEVTEFVSEDAVRINQASRRKLDRRPDMTEMVMADWSQESFLRHLDQLLREKDGKTLLGGPFDEYLVVVHTDEPLLVRSRVEEWLATVTLGPVQQITAAYLLFSYHPGVGYPVMALPVAGSSVE